MVNPSADKVDTESIPNSFTRASLETLIQRVAQGDRLAFSELYNKTSGKLFGIILRLVKRVDFAEDLLQDVYIKVWRNAGQFDAERAAPITWLATIARNHTLDQLRKRSLPKEDDANALDAIEDDTYSPGTRFELFQDLKKLEACMEGLDEPVRAMILLAYLDGVTRRDLSRQFNQPIGTVKTWLYRGLSQLKYCLGGV